MGLEVINRPRSAEETRIPTIISSLPKDVPYDLEFDPQSFSRHLINLGIPAPEVGQYTVSFEEGSTPWLLRLFNVKRIGFFSPSNRTFSYCLNSWYDYYRDFVRSTRKLSVDRYNKRKKLRDYLLLSDWSPVNPSVAQELLARRRARAIGQGLDSSSLHEGQHAVDLRKGSLFRKVNLGLHLAYLLGTIAIPPAEAISLHKLYPEMNIFLDGLILLPLVPITEYMFGRLMYILNPLEMKANIAEAKRYRDRNFQAIFTFKAKQL